MSLRSSFLEVVPPLFEGHATPLESKFVEDIPESKFDEDIPESKFVEDIPESKFVEVIPESKFVEVSPHADELEAGKSSSVVCVANISW